MGPVLIIGVGLALLWFASNKTRFERSLEPVLRSGHRVDQSVAFWRRKPRTYEHHVMAVRVGYLIGGVLLIGLGVAGGLHEWLGVA